LVLLRLFDLWGIEPLNVPINKRWHIVANLVLKIPINI